ncbi:MAG: ECF transporter S component [Candidatus Microbacterium stercoravium]|uniref:ECF transporter S component n=1 Tax=Candidatus Microbacterium stercoravium TaxID=2838697 RepID=A0A9D2H5R0_9MICO|nr:ECF transporter S component [Candidatus Microbacterium stercoravium]
MTASVRSDTPVRSSGRRLKWRVVDIVVASVIAVACAVIFIVWNTAHSIPSSVIGAMLPGLSGLLAGPWLIAGVIGGLIVRKPGAALYTEVVAATISALIGNEWGPLTILSGVAQGIGAEIILALFLFRRFDLTAALLAGAGAGLGGGINDRISWYPGADLPFTVIYISSTTISGAVLAGIGGWAIVRGLAATGALNRFAAGRTGAKRV